MSGLDTLETNIICFTDPTADDQSQLTAYERICNALTIPSAKVTFQNLITRMENQLTSVDDKIRNRASALLGDLLNDHPEYLFTAGEVHLLVVFFSRRLSDYPSIIPSLHALMGLVKNHAGKFEHKFLDVVEILQTLFELNLQGLAQNIRQKVRSCRIVLSSHNHICPNPKEDT